ncbi:MAG: hypothetical protein C4535_02965 [Comamonadaceae bacterium]|nr:MAG: hypothetical protein C4535_02965 [Comamonadaceae bacterium]
MQVTHKSRSAEARSRLFLEMASECSADRRVEFEAFLEAAIVFGRAALHRFQTRHVRHPQWKQWWDGLRKNPSIEFFRTERDRLLKEASPKIGQKAFVGSVVVRRAGDSPPGNEPTKAGDFYFFEGPEVPAAVTVDRHLRELERVLKEAEAVFVRSTNELGVTAQLRR